MGPVSGLRDRFGSAVERKETVMAGKDSGGQERVGKGTEEVDEVDEVSSDVQDRVEKLTEDVDDLLDEIDDVLETNAEEFVRSYVQKGGE
jgi:ubiquitin-like protein Pup